MSDVKWIKISTHIFDDEKIKLIEAMPESDTILVLWIKLLALAGKQNDSGRIYLSELIPYTDTMLSKIFARKEATVKLAMRTFAELGMIAILQDGKVEITNWGRHQNIDGLDRIRLQGRERARRHREKAPSLKEEDKNKNRIEGNVTRNVTVTLLPPPSSKPNKSKADSEEEVCAFCAEIGLPRSDGTFLWHKWHGNGWTNGGKPVKDWRATVRSWKAAGYLPSQKTESKKPKTRTVSLPTEL